MGFGKGLGPHLAQCGLERGRLDYTRMPPAILRAWFSFFWPFIDVSLCMYLNTYYASDSVSCVVSIQPNHAIKTSTTASGICETTSYPVRDLSKCSTSCLVCEMSSPRAGNPLIRHSGMTPLNKGSHSFTITVRNQPTRST